MSAVGMCQEALSNLVRGDKGTIVLTAAAVPRCPQTKVREEEKPPSGPSTELIGGK